MRGEAASCFFVGRGPVPRAANSKHTNSTNMQGRLQHLENLVLSLAQTKSPNGDSPGSSKPENGISFDSQDYRTPSLTMSSRSGTSISSGFQEDSHPNHSSGKLFIKEEGTSYVDQTHWRGILEEVSITISCILYCER